MNSTLYALTEVDPVDALPVCTRCHREHEDDGHCDDCATRCVECGGVFWNDDTCRDPLDRGATCELCLLMFFPAYHFATRRNVR